MTAAQDKFQSADHFDAFARSATTTAGHRQSDHQQPGAQPPSVFTLHNGTGKQRIYSSRSSEPPIPRALPARSDRERSHPYHRARDSRDNTPSRAHHQLQARRETSIGRLVEHTMDRDPRHDPRISDEDERAYLHSRAHSYSGSGPSASRYDYERQYSQPPPTHHAASSADPPASSWVSSSSHHSSRQSASYPSHPYPYPYQYPHDSVAPPPSSSATWGQWSSANQYGGQHPYYNSTSSQAVVGGRHLHSAPPPAERRPPTPPPPASPSQLTRHAPPPPASAPSPSRSGSGTPPGRYRSGFQPDYDRPRTCRRPTPNSEPSGSAAASYSGDGRSPPAEAYLIIRPHRVPRGGWATAQESTAESDSAGW